MPTGRHTDTQAEGASPSRYLQMPKLSAAAEAPPLVMLTSGAQGDLL